MPPKVTTLTSPAAPGTAALLPDRGVVKVAGEDARRLLNGLFTADVANLEPGAARYAALLTPQGKIMVDCIVAEAPASAGGGFFLDCPRALALRFVERLNFYKLRAKALIEDLSETLTVLAAWGPIGTTTIGLAYGDPRLAALGLRVMLAPHFASRAAIELRAELVAPERYEDYRIELGVPSGGADFVYGDAFPHEADMDQLGGVDFDKGCYVGQEVVSRIEHRARARRRLVPVAFEGPGPQSGSPVVAGGKPVGQIGSCTADRGLAMLRLDRVEEALAAGLTLEAGGTPIRMVKPVWAHFAFPGEAKPSS
jgi:tRNA-modifying protein YgfZ